VPIARLVDRDAIDPGPKARLAAKAINGSKNAEEDFLGQVEGFIAVAEEVHRQLNDHSLVFLYELGAGGFVAGSAPLDERRLTPADVRPTDDPRLLH
jgi:hypothetical protein